MASYDKDPGSTAFYRAHATKPIRYGKPLAAANTQSYQPSGANRGGSGGAVAAPVSTLAGIPPSPLLTELMNKGLIKEGMPPEQVLAILQLGEMRGGVAIDVDALIKQIEADYKNYTGDILTAGQDWMQNLMGTAYDPNDPNARMFADDPIFSSYAGGMTQMDETAQQNLLTDTEWFRKAQQADQAYYDTMMAGIANGTIAGAAATGGGGGGGGGRRGGRHYGGGGGGGGSGDGSGDLGFGDTRTEVKSNEGVDTRDVLTETGYNPGALHQLADLATTPEEREFFIRLIDLSEQNPRGIGQAIQQELDQASTVLGQSNDIATNNALWQQNLPGTWEAAKADYLARTGQGFGDNPATEDVTETGLYPLGEAPILSLDPNQAARDEAFRQLLVRGQDPLQGRAPTSRDEMELLAQAGVDTKNTFAESSAGPTLEQHYQDLLSGNVPAAGQDHRLTKTSGAGPGPGLAPMESWPDIIANYQAGGVPNAGATTNVPALSVASPGVPAYPLTYPVDSSHMGDTIAAPSPGNTTQPIGVNEYGQPIYDLVNPGATSDAQQARIRNIRNSLDIPKILAGIKGMVNTPDDLSPEAQVGVAASSGSPFSPPNFTATGDGWHPGDPIMAQDQMSGYQPGQIPPATINGQPNPAYQEYLNSQGSTANTEYEGTGGGYQPGGLQSGGMPGSGQGVAPLSKMQQMLLSLQTRLGAGDKQLPTNPAVPNTTAPPVGNKTLADPYDIAAAYTSGATKTAPENPAVPVGPPPSPYANEKQTGVPKWADLFAGGQIRPDMATPLQDWSWGALEQRMSDAGIGGNRQDRNAYRTIEVDPGTYYQHPLVSDEDAAHAQQVLDWIGPESQFQQLNRELNPNWNMTPTKAQSTTTVGTSIDLNQSARTYSDAAAAAGAVGLPKNATDPAQYDVVLPEDQASFGIPVDTTLDPSSYDYDTSFGDLGFHPQNDFTAGLINAAVGRLNAPKVTSQPSSRKVFHSPGTKKYVPSHGGTKVKSNYAGGVKTLRTPMSPTRTSDSKKKRVRR